MTYTGWPGVSVDARSLIIRLNAAPTCPLDSSSQVLLPATPLVNQPAMVAGNRMIDEAKIGGMTPDMLSLNGSNRSEEHTSELQSQSNLVCRLLLEKKKKTPLNAHRPLSHMKVQAST